MANLKARLKILEALVHKAKSFLPVKAFVLNDTATQAAEIAELDRQKVKVRLFRIIE